MYDELFMTVFLEKLAFTMKIWPLSDELFQIWGYNFSQKWEKCQTWVLKLHIRMDYIQNLRNNPTKPKLNPQNVLYSIYQGVSNYCNIYFYNGNMPQYSTWHSGEVMKYIPLYKSTIG